MAEICEFFFQSPTTVSTVVATDELFKSPHIAELIFKAQNRLAF